MDINSVMNLSRISVDLKKKKRQWNERRRKRCSIQHLGDIISLPNLEAVFLLLLFISETRFFFLVIVEKDHSYSNF